MCVCMFPHGKIFSRPTITDVHNDLQKIPKPKRFLDGVGKPLLELEVHFGESTCNVGCSLRQGHRGLHHLLLAPKKVEVEPCIFVFDL